MSVTFAYQARTPSGERVAGTMRALDRASALSVLRERMLVPSRLEASIAAFSLARVFGRPKPAERLAFFRAYAALEKAGVDFSTAFGILIEQARSSRMRDALSSVRSDVELGGEKMWAAMAHRPDEFSDLEVAMVAAGEEAGNREDVFDRLATFLERDEKLRKKLAAALFYPALVFAAACAISTYLVVVIIPEFAKLFAGFGVQLPPLMLGLLVVSGFIGNPFALVALVTASSIVCFAGIRFVRTAEGALALDAIRLRIPLLGGAIRKTILARLCRVIATLLQSGVNQLRALDVAAPVAESPLYARAIEAARENIASGVCASLDEALARSGQFPNLVLGFIRVGGSAGNVPQMLVKIAEYYEDDVESVLAAVPTLIQTAVTLGLGALVGAIVYAVYVPLSTLSTSIR